MNFYIFLGIKFVGYRSNEIGFIDRFNFILDKYKRVNSLFVIYVMIIDRERERDGFE